MGHEGRSGSGGQDEGTSSLMKNRSTEGPTLSKTKDERVGHPRIVSRVDLCGKVPTFSQLRATALNFIHAHPQRFRNFRRTFSTRLCRLDGLASDMNAL